MSIYSSYRRVAFVLALLCLVFAACQSPAVQNGQAPGASGAPQPEGEVYAEQTLALPGFRFIQELRALEDGALAGIGTTEDYRTLKFTFGEDGAIANTVELQDDGGGQRLYTLSASGEIFVHETANEAYISAAEPAGDDDGDADEAAEDAQDASDDAPPNIAPASGPPSGDVFVRRLDPSGNEVSSVKLQKPDTDDEPYLSMVYEFGVDAEAGVVYENAQSKVNMYDLETGEHLKTVEGPSGPTSFIVMDAGNVCEMAYGEAGVVLRCYNPLSGAQKWSVDTTEYPSNIAYNPFDEKLYVRLGRKVVGIDEYGTRNTLLELTDFSVMSPFAWIRNVVVGKDAAVYCLLDVQTDHERNMALQEEALDAQEAVLKANPEATHAEIMAAIPAESYELPTSAKLVRIALTDAANVPATEELSVSVLYEDASLTEMASAFHAENPGYRIKFREMIPQDEMQQLQQSDVDYSQIVQRVNTEIISGTASDVLLLTGLPYESYGRKNILEDLLPYMESDPEFNMEDYRPNVLNAMKQDDKLFALPVSFIVPAMPGKNGLFAQSELTTAEFFDTLFSLPHEEIPMRDAAGLFRTILNSNIGQFTDGAGNITLDSPEFTGLLDNIKKADELFKALPPIDESNTMYVGTYGNMMITPVIDSDQLYAMNIDDIQGYTAAPLFKQQFDNDFELRFPPSLRLPNTKGFTASSVYGINRASQNKDAAWEFLKFLVSEPMQFSSFGDYGCPVNIRASERLVKTYLREADIVLRNYAINQHFASGGMVREDDPYIAKYYDYQFTQADADRIEAIISQADTFLSYDTTVLDMAAEELDPFLKGQKSAQATAQTLQSRLSMYISEQQ